MSVYTPLEHADYSVVDQQCQCEICSDWRTKFKAFRDILPMVEGHDRGQGGRCSCPTCKEMRRIRGRYLAATNRRDFYCEIAWHASHSPSGTAIMEWAKREIQDNNYCFWYMISPRMTIGEWLDRFGTAIASGAVADFASIAARYTGVANIASGMAAA